MLGKLMKYEFKATGRIFLPLFVALLAVAAVNRLFISMNFTVPKIIGTTLSVIMIVAICVIALILTLQRFYRNLKSEGYLMFTLPVSTDSLIWSKLLVASIWSVVSLIVVLLAVSIMAMTGVHLQQILNAIADFFRQLSQSGFSGILCAVEAVILAVATVFSSILLLYVCMALSLLVNRRRVGFAFLMYIAITTVGQIIFAILATAIGYDRFSAMFENMTGFGQIQSAFGLYFLCVAVPGAIFYIVTRVMLKNKLNLE